MKRFPLVAAVLALGGALALALGVSQSSPEPDLLRAERLLGTVLPAWQQAALSDGQCVGVRVATELAESDSGTVADEPLLQLCGQPPALDGGEPEPLRSGEFAVVVEVLGPYSKPSGAPAWGKFGRKAHPAEARAMYRCACRPRSDTSGTCHWNVGCDPGSVCPAPYHTELQPGTWNGACVRKPCGEHGTVTSAVGVDYSLPEECR